MRPRRTHRLNAVRTASSCSLVSINSLRCDVHLVNQVESLHRSTAARLRDDDAWRLSASQPRAHLEISHRRAAQLRPPPQCACHPCPTDAPGSRPRKPRPERLPPCAGLHRSARKQDPSAFTPGCSARRRHPSREPHARRRRGQPRCVPPQDQPRPRLSAAQTRARSPARPSRRRVRATSSPQSR